MLVNCNVNCFELVNWISLMTGTVDGTNNFGSVCDPSWSCICYLVPYWRPGQVCLVCCSIWGVVEYVNMPRAFSVVIRCRTWLYFIIIIIITITIIPICYLVPYWRPGQVCLVCCSIWGVVEYVNMPRAFSVVIRCRTWLYHGRERGSIQ